MKKIIIFATILILVAVFAIKVISVNKDYKENKAEAETKYASEGTVTDYFGTQYKILDATIYEGEAYISKHTDFDWEKNLDYAIDFIREGDLILEFTLGIDIKNSSDKTRAYEPNVIRTVDDTWSTLFDFGMIEFLNDAENLYYKDYYAEMVYPVLLSKENNTKTNWEAFLSAKPNLEVVFAQQPSVCSLILDNLTFVKATDHDKEICSDIYNHFDNIYETSSPSEYENNISENKSQALNGIEYELLSAQEITLDEAVELFPDFYSRFVEDGYNQPEKSDFLRLIKVEVEVKNVIEQPARCNFANLRFVHIANEDIDYLYAPYGVLDVTDNLLVMEPGDMQKATIIMMDMLGNTDNKEECDWFLNGKLTPQFIEDTYLMINITGMSGGAFADKTSWFIHAKDRFTLLEERNENN